MEENKEEKKENILESGRYVFKGPENGDISIESLEMMSDGGNKRIWKVELLSKEKIVFKVIKF